MKLKAIVSATAMATASSFLGSAYALDINTTTPDLEVFFSGASATSKTVPAIFDAFCEPGTVDTYKDDPTSGSDGKAWTSIFCTMSAAPEVPASLQGLNILFTERFKGGSAWGPYPTDNNYYVEMLDIANAGCTDANADNTWECTWDSNRTGNLVGDECPIGPGVAPGDELAEPAGVKATKCVVPHGGVADEEPKIFAAGTTNVPDAFPAQTSFNNLAVSQLFGVVFGTPVTEDVYRALQNKQFTGDATCDPAVYDGVVNPSTGGTRWSDTHPECRPNLELGAVRSIAANEFSAGGWTDYSSDMPSLGVGANFGLMAVCRRVNGSGTQAAFQEFYLSDPSKRAVGSHLVMVTESASNGIFEVRENSGSGDVIDCMNDAFNGTGLFGFPYGAIGVQSIEKQPDHSVAFTDPAYDHWDFVKIGGEYSGDDVDGVANVVTGDYEFFFENTCQWNVALAGVHLDAATMVCDNSADADFLGEALAGNEGTVAVHGRAGNDWKNPSPTGKPVSRATRNGNSFQNVILNK